MILFSSLCSGDIFKHRQSGEVFYGYPTNRSQGRKTRIYVEEDGKFSGKTVLIDEYDVTYAHKGRKENVIVVAIDNQDIILSDAVSNSLAKTIQQGANKGPLCIILDIDSPGGRGDCMKKVCDAIKNTTNCPVIAFISGNNYGGAFSAAAGIALACDKIYIAPDAQIGTLSTPINTTIQQQDIAGWHEFFTPKSIASFGAYLTTFAEKNKRPAAMMMAMLDQNLEIVEVVTDEKGSRNIIHKGNKRPADAIIKTWSKTNSSYPTEQNTEKDDVTPQNTFEIILSAKDAIYTKMADKIIPSRSEVIDDLQLGDAKVIATSRIKTEVRKFSQSRAQLFNYYAGIEELEAQAVEIEKQMKEVSSASLKNRPTMEDERLKRLRREEYQNRLKRGGNRGRREIIESTRDRRKNPRLSNEEIANLERDIQNTYVDPYVFQYQRLAVELAFVLDDLILYYSRAAGIANKYPGAMPKGKTLRSLQLKYNSAVAKRTNLGF